MIGKRTLRTARLGLVLVASLCARPVLAAAARPAAPPSATAVLERAVLERAVLVVRHGVRSPTHGPDVLAAETGATWPDWPVAPGEMTRHGADALRRMGTALGARYRALVAPGCAVSVWADAADDRTRQSGTVLAASVAPGCGIAARWSDHAPDPLFDAPLPPDARATLEPALQAGLDRPLPASVEAALDRLQAVLAPHACAGDRDHCLRAAPTALRWGKAGPHLSGALAVAGTAAENLLLCDAQGLRGPGLTADRATDAALLRAVLPAHEYESVLLRRTPLLGRLRAAVMARAVLDLLGDTPGSANPVPGLPAATRLLVLAGHDSNLDALAGLFGLDWQFQDQPDRTAPDTALAFERWRAADGTVSIRVRVFHQSLDALRDASAITLPDDAAATRPLPIGLCGGDTACPLGRLTDAARRQE